MTVTVGKADMGQHIASCMAQLVCEELGASWKDMRVSLASNDPKFNDPLLGAQVTGGSWSTMMNFDAMSRAGAAGRIALVERPRGMMSVPASELTVREIRRSRTPKSKQFAQLRRAWSRAARSTKTFTPDDLKAITLKTADQYTLVGQSVPQLDIPSKTNGTAKYGIDTFLPGMVYGKLVLPPIRYGAKVTAVDDSDAEEGAGLRQGGRARRQDRDHVGLGRGGGRELSGCPQGGKGAQGHLGQGPLCQGLQPDPDRRGQAAAGVRHLRPVLRQGR